MLARLGALPSNQQETLVSPTSVIGHLVTVVSILHASRRQFLNMEESTKTTTEKMSNKPFDSIIVSRDVFPTKSLRGEIPILVLKEV